MAAAVAAFALSAEPIDRGWWDPSKPVVYEDFLPASAAGIFRSNLDTDTQAAEQADNSDYSLDWLAGQIGHHIHHPYELYEKVASS